MRAVSLSTVGSLLAALVLAGGCTDVRNFEGTWSGEVLAEPSVRQGFAAGTRVSALKLEHVDLQALSATLSTTDGRFSATPLTRVVKFSGDMLASLTFDGRPVSTYMHFAPIKGETTGCPATLLISLFTDEHVELRVIRGNDLFGVFHLDRVD